jgi:hypothetical protein
LLSFNLEAKFLSSHLTSRPSLPPSFPQNFNGPRRAPSPDFSKSPFFHVAGGGDRGWKSDDREVMLDDGGRGGA